MLKTIKQSLSFLSLRQRAIYFTLVVSRAFSSLLDVFGIALIALITALAANNLDPETPLVILGYTLPVVAPEAVLVLVLCVLLVFALKAAVAISLGKAISVFLARIETEKATEIARYLFMGSLSNLARFDKGEIAWASLGSPSIAFSGILASLSTFISEGVLLILVAVTFFVVDPVATLFVFGYFAIIILIIQFMIGRALKQAGVDASAGSIASMTTLDDTVGAFREIAVYNKQDYFIEKFKASRTRMAKSVGTIGFLGGMPRYVVETALMLGVVMFVGFQFLTGQLATGLVTVGVFLTGGVRIMASLLPLQSAVTNATTQVEQSRLALQLLGEARSNSRAQSTVGIKSKASEAEPEQPKNALAIEMHNLSFTYPNTSSPTLTDVSLEIAGGQHVAFIGPSGAGKTTIVDLMLGLMEPTSGELIIGGKRANHHALIEQGLVSYVPQKPGIVSGSIAENVALGIPFDEIDAVRVYESLAAAHLTEFVEGLPEGIRASVGNQGDALSGGQIQRLGLARALYNKPKLLVLDEATSALDATSEAFISESISGLGSDVTVVVIAHRLSTVQHSDVVFVVEDGKISASGSFNHLRRTVPMVAEYVKLMSFD